MCNNAVMAAVSSKDPAKECKLWSTSADNLTNRTLPRLHYLPTKISVFVVETPRIPWEEHNFVSKMVTRDHSPIPKEQAQLVSDGIEGSHGWKLARQHPH